MVVTDHWRRMRQLDDLEGDVQPDGTSCRPFTDRPSGSCGGGGARVADGRYCLPAVEPDDSGESPVKPVRAQRLPDLRPPTGRPLPRERPRPQADTLAQALGRPRKQRRPHAQASKPLAPSEHSVEAD